MRTARVESPVKNPNLRELQHRSSSSRTGKLRYRNLRSERKIKRDDANRPLSGRRCRLDLEESP